MFKKALKNKKGFTLVELMVVVAILGVLIAVAVPVYNNVTTKAELSTIKANLRIINSAIMQAQLDNVTPAADGSNLKDNYVQTFPAGPKGTTYTVGSEGTSPEIKYFAVAKLGAQYKDGQNGLTTFAAETEVKLVGDYLALKTEPSTEPGNP